MTQELWMPTKTELTARRMLVEYREANWSPSVAVMTSVFSAMHYASLPETTIVQLGCAMHSLTKWEPKATLEKMVRAKVLRSRVIRGVRHWEVNY